LPAGDEAQIRAVIDTFWAQRLAASNPPNPDYAPFLAVLSGTQRQREVTDLQKRQALDEGVRLPPNSKSRHTTLSVTVNGSNATAEECVVDDSVVFQLSDGKVVNDQVATSRVQTLLVHGPSGWTIDDGKEFDYIQGAVPCGLSHSLS
jgi:hypothetical protein